MGTRWGEKTRPISPLLVALAALEALAFIVLGAVAQHEPYVTPFDVLISLVTIACVVGTVAGAQRRAARHPHEVSTTTQTLELEEVLRRIRTTTPRYAQLDVPVAERPLAERLRSATPRPPEMAPAPPREERAAATPREERAATPTEERTPVGAVQPKPPPDTVQRAADTEPAARVEEAPAPERPRPDPAPAITPAPRSRRHRVRRRAARARARRRVAVPAPPRVPPLSAVEPQAPEAKTPAEVVIRLELTRDDLVALLRILAQGSPEEARRLLKLAKAGGAPDLLS